MSGNNKKFNVVSIIILAVLGVALIMGIVGLCIDWLGSTSEALGKTSKDADTLAIMIKDNNNADGKLYSGLGAIQAFAIIAVIAAALTACSYVVSKFVDIKVLKWVTVGCAALLIVSALLALILTFTCTNTDAIKTLKEIAEAAHGKLTFAPAAGCWLLSIFGIVGGAAGVYGGLKG
ncbi:MAG: hypothetical protein NC033_06200 [Clostridiales bacterium]|nr:hypothetical protein [Clostridiales bacterium]